MDSQFARSFRSRLESFSPGLASDIGSLPALGEDTARAVLRFLIESACLAQGTEAVRLGREKLQALPRRLLRTVEEVANDLVNLDDDYEYRRLLELAAVLDLDYMRRLVDRGLKSSDADVRDTAAEFRAKLEREPKVVRLATLQAVSAARLAQAVRPPADVKLVKELV